MRDDTLLVTGGAGFIGSHFVRDWLAARPGIVVNLDNLSYAADLAGIDELSRHSRHVFVKGDINDDALVEELLARHRPAAIVHFAAHTHVDRSIRAPGAFIQANVVGTFALLEAARRHWQGLGNDEAARFRFLHVSTDEVFGSLAPGEPPFDDVSARAPNNPYAATKAAADHLVRAWHQTYGLPVITVNCSNHYGPRQNAEKLIPRLITRGMAGETLPLYGDGSHQRDWLYVADGCAAMRLALEKGEPGASYAIGTGTATSNLDIARRICRLLDELRPLPGGAAHESLIRYVEDRPGHDRRYAVDARRLRELTGWHPVESLDSGLRRTVSWYLERQGGSQ